MPIYCDPLISLDEVEKARNNKLLDVRPQNKQKASYTYYMPGGTRTFYKILQADELFIPCLLKAFERNLCVLHRVDLALDEHSKGFFFSNNE